MSAFCLNCNKEVNTHLTSVYETEDCHGNTYILEIIQVETCAECGHLVFEKEYSENLLPEEIPF
jgi:DNA-directed RNA polymerase subunit RPC12/RpoP